ncbi:two-component system, sensor histidine kinase YesM [Pseudobutyrivibrio sp. OR37]|uniref:sensor histidine kinase n=1 Tax=Pseudobutyrivibrio sp. OR37 TaxID=1798186 RepID=UPI0008F15F3B|nr:histidine kinase [Pseudobutyrivibrio sp. OR37]SFH78535.1 two-component system, sensor histidine kinase YesM [Pseudobutyrivibrio sp. OR37]
MNKLFSKIKSGLTSNVTRKSMVVLYIIFVVFPILVSDGLILTSIYNTEKTIRRHHLENEANAIHYTFFNQVDQAAKLGSALYSSLYVHRFLHAEYASPLDYYNSYQSFFDDTLLHLVTSQSGMSFKIYIDNPTVINGAEFQTIEKAQGTDWYEYIQKSNLNKGLYFGTKMAPNHSIQRTVYFFQKLNYYDYNSKNIMLIEIDYAQFVEQLENLNYEFRAYICDDEYIRMSNGKYSNVAKNYSSVDNLRDISYIQNIEVYGQTLQIKIVGAPTNFWYIFKNKWYQLLFMLIINIALPLFVSDLMHTAYKNKLKEQETVVARKNAELLALHSQINPHFLFNSLESIRMHSLLKQENETASMVEHLAKLQRQYTEWQQDNICIENEMEFVDAYLKLQKYRFGDRLSFEIDIEDDCKKLCIPKLTLVTFVENAVVHGIESKTTPGWIFVRVSGDDSITTIEIEDTGNGIPEEDAKELLYRMRNASIDMLKEKGRVGVVNACLRLKMISDNRVTFDLDSEAGTGTLVQITIPTEFLKGLI